MIPDQVILPAANSEASVAHFTAKSPEQFKLLIVDDDPRIVDALATILGREGYVVFTAVDGRHAWDLVTGELPDLMIMDVLLPDRDGIELCRQIKENPETRLSMVILVTGIAERSRRLDGLAVGADDFLKKPIDPFELSVRVRTLLRIKELYDETEQHRKDLEKRVVERTQELQEANARLSALSRVKTNIMAVVSHELRTPLATIKSGLDLALRSDIPDTQRASVGEMVVKSLNMLEFRVRDVDIFSDPSALSISSVGVRSLVINAVDQVRVLQSSADERVRLELPADLPAVLVDPKAVGRVLAHVVDNALKFSGNKPVTLRAVCKDDTVVLTVEDKGEGIPAEDLARVFEPLEQGDASATREHAGLGMGLALAKMMLDAHQIPFRLSSEEGVGTTFTLTLSTTSSKARK